MNDDERRELLAQSRDFLAEMSWGLTAYVLRKREQMGGYPSGGSGTSAVAYSAPVERQIRERGHQPDCAEKDECDCRTTVGTGFDTARADLARFDRKLKEIHDKTRKLWMVFSDEVAPKEAPAKMKDPGCELCIEIEDHWCPSFMVADVVEQVTARRKSKKKARQDAQVVEKVRKLRLCEWCYRFSRPYRTGRMPSFEERLAHAKGQRVRVRAG